MATTFIGKFYNSNLDIKEISNKIDRLIKKEIEIGRIPFITYKISTHNYSDGKKIKIKILRTSVELFNKRGKTAEYYNLETRLKEIANMYNKILFDEDKKELSQFFRVSIELSKDIYSLSIHATI